LTPRRQAGIALALLAAIWQGGCGSSALSTTALRSQASRICGRADTRENRIPTPTATAQATAFLKRGVAAIKPELAALRRLDAGGKAAAVYRHALAELDAELRGLQASVAGLERGADPVIAIKTLQRQLAPVELKADADWRALGIPACLNR
jgi:hypothetical protein